jgi:TP901 family phage tail tape measure protein
MATIRTLAIAVVARTNKLNKQLRGVRKQIRAVGHTIAATSKRIAGLGFALAAAGAVAAAVQFEKFNRALRQSQAIMGDLTDDQMKRMEQQAIRTARATVFSGEQAAESYYFLASAGLNAEQAISALPQVASFAQAGMFDMALATDLLTDAQSALGLSVTDAQQNMVNMGRVSDVLVKANTLANASVQQFSEALTNKAGAALKVTGKSIEEGVAVLAAFADQGIKGAEAGTALGIVMRDLQTKAIQNANQFAAYGVSVFDAAGNMNNMADIVGDLESALSGMSTEQQKAALLQLGFSDKSVAFQQVLLGTSEKIRAYEAALRSAGGTTANVAARQMTPFQAALEKVKAEFLRLSAASAPAIRTVAEELEKLANRMGDVDVEELTNRVRQYVSAVAQFTRNLFDEIGRIVTKFKVLRDVIRDTLEILPGNKNELAAQLLQVENQIADIERFKDKTIGIRFDVPTDIGSLFRSTDEQLADLKSRATEIRMELSRMKSEARLDGMTDARKSALGLAENIARSVGSSLGLLGNTTQVATAVGQAADDTQDMADAGDEAANKYKNISDILSGLHQQLDTIGMSEAERTLHQLESMGASRVQLGLAKLYLAKIREVTEAEEERAAQVERLADLQHFAQQIIEDQKGPAEHLADLQARLVDALDNGLLTQDQYLRALEDARREFGGLNKEADKLAAKTGEFDVVSLARTALDSSALGVQMPGAMGMPIAAAAGAIAADTSRAIGGDDIELLGGIHSTLGLIERNTREGARA